MNKSRKLASKNYMNTTKKSKSPPIAFKKLLKMLKKLKKKQSKFKYNARKDSTMKKCHNFCEKDYLFEMRKNNKPPSKASNIISFKNKAKWQGIDTGLCRKNFCNEGCKEGFDSKSTNQQAHFQKNFSKKLYNGFVDTYSAKEVDMLKKRGALSGCVKPINHYDSAVQNALPTIPYNIFHK
jgi:hypothetical protein